MGDRVRGLITSIIRAPDPIIYRRHDPRLTANHDVACLKAVTKQSVITAQRRSGHALAGTIAAISDRAGVAI